MAPYGTGTLTEIDGLVDKSLSSSPNTIIMHRRDLSATHLREQRTAQRSAKLQRREQRPAWRR